MLCVEIYKIVSENTGLILRDLSAKGYEISDGGNKT